LGTSERLFSCIDQTDFGTWKHYDPTLKSDMHMAKLRKGRKEGKERERERKKESKEE